jgi:hypothetical protein
MPYVPPSAAARSLTAAVCLCAVLAVYAKYNNSLRVHADKLSYSQEEIEAKQGPSFVQLKCEEDLKLGEWVQTSEGGKEWVWLNAYTTTLHTLNSGIIKMSKLGQAVAAFRGICGASLPAAFFQRDAAGIRGGVELASVAAQPPTPAQLRTGRRRGAGSGARALCSTHTGSRR